MNQPIKIVTMQLHTLKNLQLGEISLDDDYDYDDDDDDILFLWYD